MQVAHADFHGSADAVVIPNWKSVGVKIADDLGA
jgi:hypothetical protein